MCTRRDNTESDGSKVDNGVIYVCACACNNHVIQKQNKVRGVQTLYMFHVIDRSNTSSIRSRLCGLETTK